MEKDQERERAALILGSKHAAAAAAAAVVAASFDSQKKQENRNKTKLTEFFSWKKAKQVERRGRTERRIFDAAMKSRFHFISSPNEFQRG